MTPPILVSNYRMKCLTSIKFISVFFYTISRLKPVQVYYRIKYLIFGKSPKAIQKHSFNYGQKVSYLPKKNNLLFDHEIASFIGIKEKFSNVYLQPLLWQYNFYYFDSVLSNEISFDNKICFLKNHLISFNDKSCANDPYVISLRSVNLIKWISSSQCKEHEALALLSSDYAHLISSIEYHLLANHLLANLKALIFFEVFFPNKHSTQRLKIWKKEYLHQLKEQILEDGGHYELSPMYHNIILEDLIDLRNILLEDRDFIDPIDQTIMRMLKWSKYLAYVSTGLPVFFHDSCGGVSRNYTDLLEYAENSNIEVDKKSINKRAFHVKHFRNSGYIYAKNKYFIVRLNCSSIACTYNPGHFHSSNLTYDVESFNEQIFVSSGLSTYAESQERYMERSDYYHPSITQNKQNHSQIWKSFRMGKNPKLSYSFKTEESMLKVEGNFKGSLGIIYNRSWLVDASKVEITEKISGKIPMKSDDFIISIPLHPDIQPSRSSEGLILTSKKTHNSYLLKLDMHRISKLAFEQSYHCRNFGVKEPSTRILIRLRDLHLNEFKYFLTKI